MIVCIHEDRPDHLVGVRLLLLSLRRWWPGTPVVLSCPNAADRFVRWTRDFDAVSWAKFPVGAPGRGVNVKPDLLLGCLQAGFDDVVWIDSDIIVTSDPAPLLSGLDPRVLIATEESRLAQNQGSEMRTRAWGFEPARVLPRSVNSGIVRVTGHHRPLLEAWRTLLDHPVYLQALERPWRTRPLHMFGDQEVLAALLGAQEFAAIPVRLLACGREVVQCDGPGGFGVADRVRALLGRPPTFVHSLGPKPWAQQSPIDPGCPTLAGGLLRLRRRYVAMHLELSTYTTHAREYRAHLGDDGSFLDPMPSRARRCRKSPWPHPYLRGLPLAALDATVRRVRRGLGMGRIGLDASFRLPHPPL